MVAPPADPDGTQAGQVRRQPLHVEQGATSPLQGLDQGHESNLGRVPLTIEHRLAGEQPSYSQPVQAA